MRSRCANMDPRRANRLRHPVARLYAEYLWGYVTAIRGAPLTSAERQKCYRILMQWFAGRATGPRIPPRIDMAAAVPARLTVETVVAGSGRSRPSSLPISRDQPSVVVNPSSRLIGL